jgi:hypothetical protein
VPIHLTFTGLDLELPYGDIDRDPQRSSGFNKFVDGELRKSDPFARTNLPVDP